jgi:nucleoid DNA-binding protein
LFDKMSDELNNGKEIQISDFGTFSLTTKSLRPIVKYSMKKKR